MRALTRLACGALGVEVAERRQEEHVDGIPCEIRGLPHDIERRLLWWDHERGQVRATRLEEPPTADEPPSIMTERVIIHQGPGRAQAITRPVGLRPANELDPTSEAGQALR